MLPSTGDKQAEAQDLAEKLLGTCLPLPDHVLDDQDLCVLLDQSVMLCECCGWWMEVHEIDDEGNCEDCA